MEWIEGYTLFGRVKQLRCEGFIISVLWSDVPLFGTNGDYETALFETGSDGRDYRILKGDHSAAYEKLAPLGFEACLAYFNAEQHRHVTALNKFAADIIRGGEREH